MVFIGTKEECKQALLIVREEAKRLKLTIHEGKTYFQSVKRPIRFLGFSFLLHPTGRVALKRLPEKIRHEKRKLMRMAKKGVSKENMMIHYQGARECLSKGTRSDLMQMDRFFKSIIRSVDNNADCTQR